MPQNWCRCYQNLCKSRQLKMASVCVHCSVLQIWVGNLRRSLYFNPRLCPVCLGFPEAFQCAWPRTKAVQALPVVCHVCVPNVRGCGWWREFAGSVLGQSVQRSLCHSHVLALRSHSCRGLPFRALSFWELYRLDLFVCTVTGQVCVASHQWAS